MRDPRKRPSRPILDIELGTTRPSRSALTTEARPLFDLLGEPGASATLRERIGDMVERRPTDRDDTRRREPGRLNTDIKDFEGPEIRPDLVLELADVIKEMDMVAERGALDALSGAILDNLSKKSPDFLPREPLPEGAKGARLPLPAPVLAPLIARAAMELQDGAPRVVWDDGINQLIVDLQAMTSTLDQQRINVMIPLLSDQSDTTVLTVPFATGGKTRNAGMVLATTDRPLGDALIARIWGDALIALARGALLSVVGAMAGASGRDVRNDRLVPRSLFVTDGILSVETEAQRRFRRDLK